MKLSYYIEKLQEIEKNYPNALVVYAHKDQFFKVRITPTEGEFTERDFEDDTFETNGDITINAVSLN